MGLILCTRLLTPQSGPGRIVQYRGVWSWVTHGIRESLLPMLCGLQADQTAMASNVNVPDNFNQLTDAERIKVLINIDNVKSTAQFIVEAFNLRNKLLFLKS